MWDMDLKPWNVLVRIALAVFFGGLIGIERQRKGKPAGIRTLMLVSLGSCMFVLAVEEIIVSVEGAARLPIISPVISAVIGGIGFLGAGTIIRNQTGVEGVTTAAAIWVTAGIGVTCGLGEFGLATVCGAAALLTLGIIRVGEWGYRHEADHDGSDKPPRSPA